MIWLWFRFLWFFWFRVFVLVSGLWFVLEIFSVLYFRDCSWCIFGIFFLILFFFFFRLGDEDNNYFFLYFFPGCEMTNGYFSTLEFSGYIFLILFNINFLFYFPGCEMTNWFFCGPGITFWVSFIFNIVFWSLIFSLRDFVDVQWNIKDLRWLRWLRWMRWGMDCNLKWLRWLQWTRWEYEMIKMTTMDEMRNGGNMRWLRWLRWMRWGMEFASNSLSIFKTVASLEKTIAKLLLWNSIFYFIQFNLIASIFAL